MRTTVFLHGGGMGGWAAEEIGPALDHAFIAGAPERVLDYLRPKP